MLYLPVTGGGGNVAHEIEMRPTKDGRMALLAYSNAFEQRAVALRDAATHAAKDAAAARSGNPAVRAGTQPPRAEAIERARQRGTGSRLVHASDDAAKWGKRIARGSVIGAIAIAGWELANGESPSGVAVNTAAGMTASAVTGLAVTAVAGSAPVWVPVVASVAAGAVVAWGVGMAYEALVPQSIRETIDEGIRDVWDGVTDFAGDVWGSIFG